MTNEERTLNRRKHPSISSKFTFSWEEEGERELFSMSMKGKDHTLMKGAASTDLRVCFPSRSILSLRPKTIFFPSEPQLHLPPHLKRTNGRGVGLTMSSPLLRVPHSKQFDLKNAEPTSPKVSCAGQIKASSKSNHKGCKSGQSLIEEIERIHNKGKKKHWLTSFGLKKEVGHLLSCLRGLRFDLRILCLNNLPNASDDGDDENDGDGENNSNTLFSKWFMVLQENHHNYDLCTRHRVSVESIAPPTNALLLMRCRSAPAKQLSVRAKDVVERCFENKDGRETTMKLRCLMDEEKMKELHPDEPMKKMKKKKKKTKKECYLEMRETWFNARSKSWKM